MYLNQGNKEDNFFCFNPAHEYLNFWLVATMKNQIIAWLKLKIWISIQGPDVSWLIKVHISWEGHKSLTTVVFYLINDKSTGRIRHIFMAFWEYLNFIFFMKKTHRSILKSNRQLKNYVIAWLCKFPLTNRKKDGHQISWSTYHSLSRFRFVLWLAIE